LNSGNWKNTVELSEARYEYIERITMSKCVSIVYFLMNALF
jgi:hypothetical protein